MNEFAAIVTTLAMILMAVTMFVYTDSKPAAIALLMVALFLTAVLGAMVSSFGYRENAPGWQRTERETKDGTK